MEGFRETPDCRDSSTRRCATFVDGDFPAMRLSTFKLSPEMWRLVGRLASAVLLGVLCQGPASVSLKADDDVDAPAAATIVFRTGDDRESGFGYRIPALVVTKAGTLLAFCERRVGLHDHAENDIVLRRSVDGGATWEDLQLIADEQADSLNDPCVVALDTGRILLRYTRFPRGVHARRTEHTVMAEPGYDGPKNVRLYLTHSDDDGRTWSPPRDVTRMMRRADAISVGSPGVAVQLTQGRQRGRIVFPNYEVYRLSERERTKANSVSLSDDGGATWRLSATIDEGGLDGYGDEAQLVELGDGRLLLSARNEPQGPYRKLSMSRDGGDTWTPHRLATDLLTPPCMSSIIRYTGPPGAEVDLLLHSLPYAADSRRNGTIMISRDQGQTWTPGKIIAPQGFAYSCLAQLPGGDVGCLFETGRYRAIAFVRLTPDELPAP